MMHFRPRHLRPIFVQNAFCHPEGRVETRLCRRNALMQSLQRKADGADEHRGELHLKRGCLLVNTHVVLMLLIDSESV